MDVRDYIQQHAGDFFADLKQWLAIPSISADPGHHQDVRASAEWLAAHLRATGFPEVEIWETGSAGSPGLPAVFACWPAADPAAPAVCVYGHHDVQPVGDLTQWLHCHAGAMHIDQQRTEAAMLWYVRIGADKKLAEIGAMGVSGPDLLSIYYKVIALQLSASLNRGQVGTGARLGHALAPDFVGAQDWF